MLCVCNMCMCGCIARRTGKGAAETGSCATVGEAAVVTHHSLTRFRCCWGHTAQVSAAARCQPLSYFFAACVTADAQGFLQINEFLQSAGGPPEVFAVGDVATSVTHPRPKAGVYAVRQVGLC